MRIILLFLLQLACLQGYAQLVNLEHYSTADGLADGRITLIKKGKDGFMWFGSWAGISRFDGYQFKTFKSYPGDNSPLRSNRIDDIVEDDSGNYLWLQAYDKKIYRFDKRTGIFVSLTQLLTEPGFEKVAFTRILAVRGKDVWIKTENEGLILVSNAASEQPELSKFPYQNIHVFHLDANNNAWIVVDKGLAFLERGNSGNYATKKEALNETIVTDLIECKNTVSLGTSDGKLIKFDLGFNQLSDTQISKGAIHKVIESRKFGNKYCSTALGELILVDGRNSAISIFKSKDSSPLGHIYEDTSGALWIGSKKHGVIRHDPLKNRTDYFYERKDYKIMPGLRNFTAFDDRNGIVYVSLDGQMNSYNPRLNKMEELTSKLNNYPKSTENLRFCYDDSGILWLASGHEGIDKLVFQDNPFKHILVRPDRKDRESNEVRSLFHDSQNRLWVGTKHGEIFLYENGEGSPQPITKGFDNKAGVYNIRGDQRGSVWIATKGNGLFQGPLGWRNGEKINLTHFFPIPNRNNSISSTNIYGLLEDHTGKIWVGAFDHGLMSFETIQGKTIINTIYNSFRKYPVNDFRKIRNLMVDRKGLIWVATTDGLMIFDPNQKRLENLVFKIYKKEPGNIQSLGGNDIQYIYEDTKGRVWILTTTGGLNLAIGQEPLKSLSFTNYSTKNGLPSDYLLSCIEDKQGYLWITTQNGLSKFSVQKQRFQNFTRDEELQNLSFSEASIAMMNDGRLIFGTNKGLLSLQPAAFKISKISAPLVLTNLQINSEDIIPGEGSPLHSLISHTKRITLEHDQNIISLDFAVLDFHATNKQAYACRLIGFDDVWRSTEGQRRATYTKLPPGKYTFQVKSLNDELYKKNPFTSLEIVIHPPLWQTWWAYTFYGAAFVTAIVLLRKNELTMLKLKQQVAVEKQVSEMKLDFFNQISHELRTPLAMIIGPSEEIITHEKLSERGSEYIAIVLANAKRMLHLVNQVLNLRKVKSGKDSLHKSEVEILETVRRLIFSFKETTDARALQIEVISSFDEVNGWVDEHKFEIIIYNLLGNAIKFSANCGLIKLIVAKSEDGRRFTVTVADQGTGVAEEELEQIFNLYFEGTKLSPSGVKGTGIGLALSKELVQLHGGQINAEHNMPKGLKVTVELELSQLDEQVNVHAALGEASIGSEKIVDNERPYLLIVEDNVDMRNFLKRKFDTFYRVEMANDGEEGLAKARELVPGLVLSDIMMPKMDGIQLLDALKNDPATSHIPVILLSAKFSIESQIEGLKYGADYYLPKPFNWDLLKMAVEYVLKQRQTTFKQLQNKEKVDVNDVIITAYDKQFLDNVLKIVEDKLDDAEFNIDDVADSLSMSRSAFYRKFRSLTGTAPIDFVKDTRLNKAKELFDAGEHNVSVVAYKVGFNSPKYFTLCFRTKYQQTPSEYLKLVRGK